MKSFAEITNADNRNFTEINKSFSQKYTSKCFSFLQTIFQNLVTVITSKNELQVWQKSDRSGNTEWHAYDPATGRSVCVASEQEMRYWIEERYYQ